MNKHLIASALGVFFATSVSAAEMTVISYGGISKTVQTEVFYQTFEAAHHVKVIAQQHRAP